MHGIFIAVMIQMRSDTGPLLFATSWRSLRLQVVSQKWTSSQSEQQHTGQSPRDNVYQHLIDLCQFISLNMLLGLSYKQVW